MPQQCNCSVRYTYVTFTFNICTTYTYIPTWIGQEHTYTYNTNVEYNYYKGVYGCMVDQIGVTLSIWNREGSNPHCHK